MNLRHVASLLVVALLAVVLSGCDTTPPVGKADPIAPGTYPQTVVIDGLVSGVVFGDPIVTVGTDKVPMHVTLPIRSIVDDPINIQYKVEFFDAAKRPLTNTNQGYRFMNLAPRVEQFMEATALDTNAVDYRVLVRSAR